MSTTYSRLSAKQRANSRRLIRNAALLMYRHRGEVHYTQNMNRRWEGINKGYRGWRGQFPRYADCSSAATWLLWQAYHHYGLHDRINGTGWRSGYTGTLALHGKTIRGTIKIGDLIFYGSGWPYQHVAVSLGGRRVWSHGSEPGPYLLDIDYRSDRQLVKRYI